MVRSMDLENLQNESGTADVSLLLPKFREVKLVKSPSCEGIDPASWLEAKFSVTSLVRRLIVVGIVPEMEFNVIDKIVRAFIFPMVVGRLPRRLDSDNWNLSTLPPSHFTPIQVRGLQGL